MAAYVLVEMNVTDPSAIGRYRELAHESVTQYGGRYIARGGTTVTLEGHWQPPRVVLLEFPDLESAQRWYNSPEYGEAKAARENIATAKMVAVEGL